MEVSSSHAATPPVTPAFQAMRRKLIVRDSLKFLTLTACAVVLAGITGILFRSFEARREDLAIQWAQRGNVSLQQGHSAQAVSSLRTSLSYRPDDTTTQLMLAQALAAAGHTSEAENYFLNLWQSRPGDGPINLQLARLERSRGNASTAIDYYRAAVFGTWSGDAPQRRRDTRLELAKYLIERGQLQAAQADLLVAAGNNPDAASQLAIAETLEAANDPRDAFAAYRNAMEDRTQQPVAQAKAGELCYRMGDYSCTADLLDKALSYKGWTGEQVSRMSTLAQQADRLQQLSISKDIPVTIRTMHLLDNAHIAQMRLASCAETHADLQSIQAQWKKLDTAAKRSALRHDEDVQDAYTTLITDTETAVTSACGAPTGDDALLVFLQTHPMTHAGAQ